MRIVQVGARVSASRIAVGILALAFLASACHVPGTSSGADAGGASIVVGVVPGADNAPLRVAVKEGLFRDRGLNVTIKTYSSLRPEIQDLIGGHIAIAAGDYADFFYEQAAGHAKLHIIADGYDATSNLMELLTLPGSNVTTPQDLVGKTVATPEPQLIPPSSPSGSYLNDNAPYNIETLATEAVLQSDGVSPSSVTWKPTPAQDIIGDLQNRQVSAILVTEPQVLEAESQLGAVELLDSLHGATGSLPLSGYFSLASYDRAHAATLSAFREALETAQAQSAMRGPVQAVLPSFTGVSPQMAQLVTLGSYPTFLSVGQVQRVAALMYDSGMLSNPLNVRSLISG
jgi:NitT/TauT family transport system substrate-binding protein